MSDFRAAVLGSPIAHSLSPTLHRRAYALLGLDGQYDAIEVTEDQLPGFVESLDPHWRGLSLTMPLKRAVLPLLDRVDETVTATGAANTVVFENGGRVGANTDVSGAVAALRERGVDQVDRAIVIGGGATAGSMMLALAQIGCTSAEIWVRDAARADEAATIGRAAGVDVVVGPLTGDRAAADVVVSTIPAAAQGDALLDRVAAVPVVFEVVYDGWPTPLARSASGRVLVSGLDLLVHQAVGQVRLMTGREGGADLLAAMRSAGDDELSARMAR